MSSIMLNIALGALVVATVTSVVYNVSFHPLRKVPGPWLSAATRLPYIHATLTGQLPHHLHRLHQRYGPVVRTAPNEVSFIDGEACKIIHVRRDTSGHIFPKNYDTWQETSNYFTQSIFLTGHENHGRMRRALGTAFSDRMLREHEPTIVNNVDRFIAQLANEVRTARARDHALPSARVDLDERFHWLAFDTISEFVFGEGFNCLSDSDYRGWLRRLSTSWRFIAIVSSMKQIVSVASRILDSAGLLQSRVDILAPLDSKSDKNWEKMPERPTLLSIGRACLHDETLSRLEVTANAAFFTVAGTDTTAAVLPSVVYLLLRHPTALQRLQGEIRELQSEADITFQSVHEIPFLTACILEAMRLYPPTPEGLPRVVPGTGQVISGYWIPGGTAVQISAYAAYRSPMNFDDPDSFVPERWVSVESSKTQMDDGRGVFHPFSTGPRNCIGQSFAMAEVRLALVKLLWKFDLDLLSNEDWMKQRCFLLWEKKPLLVQLTPRVSAEVSDTT